MPSGHPEVSSNHNLFNAEYQTERGSAHSDDPLPENTDLEASLGVKKRALGRPVEARFRWVAPENPMKNRVWGMVVAQSL